MNLSMLLAFGTTEIVLVSVFGAVFIGLVLYYCFVPMKNLFTALFSGAYIPSFKLIGIKNRRLVVNEVVEAFVMAKKSELGLKLNQIESVMLSGGDVKAVISAMNLAKNSGIDLSFELASSIELAKHNIMEVVGDAVQSKVVEIKDIRAFAQDKIEIIASVNASVKVNLEKYATGLGLDELKSTINAWMIENISKTQNHADVLKSPNKTLLSSLDLRVIAGRSMYSVLDINVSGVETGRDLNAEMEVQAAEKEKIYAEIEAERMKNAEEIRELKMRTRTEQTKAEVLMAEKEIPLAISQAIKEGRFSVMDYYKLMNLQADTAMRRAFLNDNKKSNDFDDEGEF